MLVRLGFPVRIIGRSDLRNHDGRRWQNRPHLSVSLAYVRDIFLYLQRQRIHMYRLSADLAPYLTHPDLPHFHDQISECEDELDAIGQMVPALNIRLSFHAPAHILLNSPNPHHVLRSVVQLNALAALLDAMHLGPEAVIVVHVGGIYEQPEQARERFILGFCRLDPRTQQRLALEHDDRHFSVSDIVWLHQRLGVRLIFDLLHHQLKNPRHLPIPQALAMCLATWPPGQTPKIHISTPATELVRDRKSHPHPPRLNRHSHYINPFTITSFLRDLPRMRDFDIMLEAKACDLALLQLRRYLHTRAPDVVDRYHLV